MNNEILTVVHKEMSLNGLKAAAFFINGKFEMLEPLLEETDESGFAFAHYLALLGYVFPENHAILRLKSKHSISVAQIYKLRVAYFKLLIDVCHSMQKISKFVGDISTFLNESELVKLKSELDDRQVFFEALARKAE